MTLYIYNQETNEIEVIINGTSNEMCEAKAEELDFDLEIYAWSYNDNGLSKKIDTKII